MEKLNAQKDSLYEVDNQDKIVFHIETNFINQPNKDFRISTSKVSKERDKKKIRKLLILPPALIFIYQNV